MSNEPSVERVVVSLRENRLILELDRPLLECAATHATIDMGALGRLIGIEIEGVYLAISDPVPGSELQGRSLDIAIEIEAGGRQVAIPRCGQTWELSFPSGNQCWHRHDALGQTHALCSILTGT